MGGAIKPFNPRNPFFEFARRGVEAHKYFVKEMVGAICLPLCHSEK